MTAPILAEVLREHALGQYSWGPEGCASWSCGWNGDTDEHPAHQAAVWREVCTIRTVEQLDALPDAAVVRDAAGDVWEHDSDKAGSSWLAMGYDLAYDTGNVELPALLVWHPGWEAS